MSLRHRIAGGALKLCLCMAAVGVCAAEPGYRDIRVAPEHRCALYDAKEYAYGQAVEKAIIEGLDGEIFSPYEGCYYENPRQTDIEHILARSEAHDSGMCDRSTKEKERFSVDLDNLTLAGAYGQPQGQDRKRCGGLAA